MYHLTQYPCGEFQRYYLLSLLKVSASVLQADLVSITSASHKAYRPSSARAVGTPPSSPVQVFSRLDKGDNKSAPCW